MSSPFDVVVRYWIEYVFGSPVYTALALMIISLTLSANYRLSFEVTLLIFFAGLWFTTYFVLPKILFVLFLVGSGLILAYAFLRWKL